MLFPEKALSRYDSNFAYELIRGESRTFFCPNKLWFTLNSEIVGRMSVSNFIRLALIEKMKRDNPKKVDVYDDLLRN